MDIISRNAQIVSLYNDGLYPMAIRDKMGVSLTQIYRILHKANVSIRSQAESHRRHQMDFTFFERIDSHEKAQILGFIAADGCVTYNTIKIGLAHEDHAYLEWIKSVIGYTGQVRVYPSRRSNEQPMSILSLCSPKMVEDITRLGCGQRKSLTLQWPTEEQIPSEFLSSYMLGYFEGDGSISCHQRKNRPRPEFVLTIAGTRSFCESYAKALDIPPRVIDLPNNAIQLLRLDGNRQVKRVMDYLYSHATHFMPRKRAKYDLLKAQLDHLDEYGWTVPSRRKTPSL